MQLTPGMNTVGKIGCRGIYSMFVTRVISF